jgi:PII-like signaling protein
VSGSGGGTIRVERQLRRLTAYVAEPRRGHDQWAVTRLLSRAAELRLSGGTVLAGLEGFGYGHHLHHTRWFRAADETPLTLIVVDTADRIAGLLPVVRELLPRAVVTVEDVRAIRYIRRHEHRGAPGGPRPG